MERERLSALMLEHLYGLLEPQEVRELETALAGPHGDELRREAEHWKAKLTAAAKSEFPTVTFAPPKSVDPVTPSASRSGADQGSTATGTSATRTDMSAVWSRWAIAAGLLLVLGGLGIPAGKQFVGWWAAKSGVNEKTAAWNSAKGGAEVAEAGLRAAQARATADFERAVKNEAEVVKEYEEALAAARKAIDQKDFMVRLVGPSRAMPGAPNEWRIDTLDKANRPTLPKKMDVIVRGGKNEELLRETHQNPLAPASLKLSPAFWDKVAPGSDIFLEVVAYTDDNRKSVLCEKVPLARSVYVTHVTTDKPLYKPGETVRFRSLTLDRSTFLPPEHDMGLTFKLVKPDGSSVPLENGNGRVMNAGNLVLGPDRKPIRGIGTGEVAIGDDDPGGEYQIQVFEHSQRTGEKLLESRKFIVNKYQPDRFEKKLEFDAKTYGAGEIVQARLEISRTQGGDLTKVRVSMSAMVDGANAYRIDDLRPDARGTLNIRFTLPATIRAGLGTLSVNIVDGADNETIVRPIPLVGRRLSVDFYPEGGDLIQGVSQRVYFQVRTPAGKPADVQGVITDGTAQVAEVRTMTDAELPGVNRGLGVFTFKPEAGKKYYLQVKRPINIETPIPQGFALPDAKADGIALTALDRVVDKGTPIRVRLETPAGKKTVHVGAYARGRLIHQQEATIEAGKPTELKLSGDDKLGGVTRVTVFEEVRGGDGKSAVIPRVERLLFRYSAEQLLLNVQTNKARYTPAGKVTLDLTSMNEKEKPTPAVLMVAVVNQSVITMADNKTDRMLPTHFYLAGEVKSPGDLEHADFLLTDHPQAGESLDLLLGTQGWRRFAEQNSMPVRPEDRPEVDRMLVAHGRRTEAPVELFRMEEQRVNRQFELKLEQAAIAMSDAEDARSRFFATELPRLQQRAHAERGATTAADEQRRLALANLYEFETRTERFKGWAMPLFLLGLLAVGVTAGVLAFLRRLPDQRRRFVLMAGGAFAGSIVVIAAMFVTQGTVESGREANFANIKKAQGSGNAMFNPERTGAPAPKGAMMKGDFAAKDAGGAAEEGAGPLPPMAAPQFAPGGPDPRAVPAPAGPRFPLGGGRPDPQADRRAEKAGQANAADKPVNVDQLRKLLEFKKVDDEKMAKARGNAEKEQMNRRRDALQFGRQMIRGRAPGLPGGGGRMAPGAAAGGLGPVPADGVELRDIPQLNAVPFVVREYAHQRDASLPAIRSDYTETVYWHPVLVVPDSGSAKVEFQLSDDIATYQVLVAGHTTDGRIGAAKTTLQARKPITIDVRMPMEINSNDVIDVPVRVFNDTEDIRKIGFDVKPSNLQILTKGDTSLMLKPSSGGRAIYRVKASELQGNGGLVVTANADPLAEPDSSFRDIKIVPEGFPGVGSISDMLETRAAGKVTLPKDLVKGTLKARLEVYPTTMADLVKGLEGLLREPYGCFEQTSTTNYPNTLILDYIKQTNQTAPDASKRAKELLDRGYARLISYECPDTPEKVRRGFEWFGAADSAHEALTAYGLMQFVDMARVHSHVDAEMIKRTRDFLMSRRDGKGGFKRNPRALDTFGGAPKHTTDAYIVWALVESDPDNNQLLDLKTEIAAIKTEAMDENSTGGKDPYFVALTAGVLLKRNDRDSAVILLDRLQSKFFKDGRVQGASASITRSGGRDLEIEATAFAMLAWMGANEPKYSPIVKDATKWISAQRGGYGGFGSTQSTIMALKALIAYAKKTAHPAESGDITVKVGGRVVAVKKFSEKDVEVIAVDIEKPEELFKPGETVDVQVETTAKHPYPFTFGYTYTSLTPVSAEKCLVDFDAKLAKNEAVEGETVALNVTLTNKTAQGHGMATAIVGLPAGMKVPTDMKQLTDLREKGLLSYFEMRGRELVIYWRQLAPSQKIDLSIDLVCDIPGEFRGPASRGYLYYNADHKKWVDPLTVTIKPGKGDVEQTAAVK